MTINEYLKTFPWNGDMRHAKRVVCADGFSMSVQASAYHYCSPRISNEPEYFSCEIGFPSERVEALMKYAEDADRPTDTVYGWVPVALIDQIIAEHGGFAAEKAA